MRVIGIKVFGFNRVLGLRLRVQDSGFRVWGSGLPFGVKGGRI
jgi:hypothetical protein